MATTVGQHPLTQFTTPLNGTSPIDADEVRDNDNAVRTAYNAHDADTGIHVQSSTFGTRPTAGTSGRKWITVDQLSAPTQVQLNYDDGTNWYALNYFPSAVTVAAGGITITGTLGTVNVPSSGASLSFSRSDANYLRASDAAGFLILQTGGMNNRVVVDATGNVGIGTDTPSAVLHVVGNSTITGTLGGLTGLTVASGGISVTATTAAFGHTYASSAHVDSNVTTSGTTAAFSVRSRRTAAADFDTLYGTVLYASVLTPSGFSDTIASTLVVQQASGAATNLAIEASGQSYIAKLWLDVSATNGASLRIPHGAAPTSPVDGDMWTTTAGLFVRINGVTKTVTLT